MMDRTSNDSVADCISRQAAVRALEEQKYMIRRQDVIDELMTWDGHCITAAEQWHLRQVIGSIKSIPGGENDT